MLTDQIVVQDEYVQQQYHYPPKTESIERKFEADRVYIPSATSQPPALYTRAGCNPELDTTAPRPPWSIGPNIGGAVFTPRIEPLVGNLAGVDLQLLIFILLIALVVYQYVMLRKLVKKVAKLKARN